MIHACVKSGLVGLALVMMGTPVLAQGRTCDSSRLFYTNAEYMALTTDAEKKAFAARTATDLWGPVTGEVAKIGGVYGMGQGLVASAVDATAGDSVIEKAMTLSADRMAQYLKGKTYTAGRVRNVLGKLQTGAPPGATLASAFTAIGVTTDVVNVINHSLNAMESGDRTDRARAAQAVLSLSRTGLGAGWGGAMGPMMAMAGLVDYSINAFGTEAYAQYDAYWYNGYKGFQNETRNHSASRWLEIYEAEGRSGIRARLDSFWDDPVYNAATYQDARTISGDALAGAEYRDEFARRYMIEVVEPKIAAAFEERALDTMYTAMDDFAAQCVTALEEARAIAAAQALLTTLGDGVSVDNVYAALLDADMDRLRGYLDAGFDVNHPTGYNPDNPDNPDLPFMYLVGMELITNPQMESGIRQLIDAGGITDIPDPDVVTPVVVAVRQGKSRAALTLIDLGYPVDFVWDNGRTLIAEAARAGMRDVVAAMLDTGADPDGAGGEAAAILHAAARGHGGIVQDLLARGSDVNVTTRQGATALHLAARAGHSDIVRTLVGAGADTGMTIGTQTAADVARGEGFVEIADYLNALDAGPPVLTARVNKLVMPGHTGEAVLMMDGRWQRPLQISVEAGAPHLVAIREAALRDANVTRSMIPEENGRLYLEVWFDALSEGSTDLTITVTDASGHTETVAQDVMIGAGYSTYRGRLVEAARAYDPQAIRDVVGDIYEIDAALGNDPSWISQAMREDCIRGPSRECEAYLGSFIAYHVAGTDDEALLDWLLEWDVDPNYTASNGENIVMNAAASGNWGQVDRLLDAGANPNCSRNGATPLLYTVGAGQTDLVRKMLELGADPNAGSVTKGMTPLHHAAANNSAGIIDLLLGAGAELYYDDDGRAPGWFSYWEHDDLDLALRLGYDEARDYEDRDNEPETDWSEFEIVDDADTVIVDDEDDFEIELWADPEIIDELPDDGAGESSCDYLIVSFGPSGDDTWKMERQSDSCIQQTETIYICDRPFRIVRHSNRDYRPNQLRRWITEGNTGIRIIEEASGRLITRCSLPNAVRIKDVGIGVNTYTTY